MSAGLLVSPRDSAPAPQSRTWASFTEAHGTPAPSGLQVCPGKYRFRCYCTHDRTEIKYLAPNPRLISGCGGLEFRQPDSPGALCLRGDAEEEEAREDGFLVLGDCRHVLQVRGECHFLNKQEQENEYLVLFYCRRH